jgi:hypothetical protein
MGLGVRIFVIIIAIVQPIAILLVCGADIPSISSTWTTVLQPLFIVTNAMTSYLFFEIKKWKIPAMLLLLLTAFSVEFSLIAHNIIATGFFLSCLFPLIVTRRLKGYLYVYIGSIFTFLFFGIFWFEVWAVYTLCAYHLHIILYKISLLTKKGVKNLELLK